MDERSYRGGHPPYCTCVNCTVKRKSPKKGFKIFKEEEIDFILWGLRILHADNSTQLTICHGISTSECLAKETHTLWWGTPKGRSREEEGSPKS